MRSREEALLADCLRSYTRPVGCDDADTRAARRQAWDFLVRRRTYEAFRLGPNCPPEHRLLPSCMRPYNLSLNDLCQKSTDKSRVPEHRTAMTFWIGVRWRTALGATLKMSFCLMFLSSMNVVFIRNCAWSMSRESYMSVAGFINEVGSLVKSLTTAVSFLLSFYAIARIQRFWAIQRAGWLVQGRCHDLGMLAGAVLGDSEKDWRARYALYRHLLLCFFFTYQSLTPNFRGVGFRSLSEAGLLFDGEQRILERAHKGPGTVCESWVAKWIQLHMSGEARHAAFQSLRELRGGIGGVNDLVDERAPVSFESLLYIAVTALVWMMPFSPIASDITDRELMVGRPHAAEVFGDGVIIAFYLSLLHMLRHLESPFDNVGAPYDCLNPMAIILSTEKKLRDYLTMPQSEYSDGTKDPAVREAPDDAALQPGFTPSSPKMR